MKYLPQFEIMFKYYSTAFLSLSCGRQLELFKYSYYLHVEENESQKNIYVYIYTICKKYGKYKKRGTNEPSQVLLFILPHTHTHTETLKQIAKR